MPKSIIMLLAALLLAAPHMVMAADPLWWSESTPHAGHGEGRHSHGGPVEIKRGVYYKNLWLRAGEGPARSRYLEEVAGARILLVAVNGEVRELAGTSLHEAYGVSFPMPEEGFYNLYLQSESVSAGTRLVKIAKFEALKHSCREGHDHVKALLTPRYLDSLPLEIVRERLPGENFHTNLGFGDTVTFRVLRFGQPVAAAEVTLATARGWLNRARTDASGRVSFMVIRDYYPPWHEFNRRHRQDYLVTAVHATDEAGGVAADRYSATSYLASLSGSYHPSARDYRSYAYGLLLGVFALSFTGGAVYFHRRLRRRPFREIRFDDQNDQN